MSSLIELIKRFVAPALPNAPANYNAQFFDSLCNILRLYFNRIDQLLSDILAVIEGRNRARYGQFASSVTQTAAAINTAYAVTFNTSAFQIQNQGVRLRTPSTSQIEVDAAGIYSFIFSVQLDKTAGGSAVFWVWWRVNGVNVPASASQIQIQGNNHEIFSSANIFLQLAAGDYVELMWAVSDTSVQLQFFPAAGVVPAIPSVILTAANNVEGEL